MTSTSVLEGFLNHVSSVSWSPDGRYLAAGSLDGTVRLFSSGRRSLGQARVRKGDQDGEVLVLVLGTNLVAAGKSQVCTWDVSIPTEWTSRRLWSRPDGSIRVLAGSSATMLATAAFSDGAVALIDVASGAPAWSGSLPPSSALAMGAQSSRVVVASDAHFTAGTLERPDAQPGDRPARSRDFNVFLCHSSADKPVVERIAGVLESAGVRCWLDENELAAGTRWVARLNELIGQIEIAAICLGPGGLGPVQKHEIEALLAQMFYRNCTLIPLLLPGFAGKLPFVFLDSRSWIDLRDDEANIMQLVHAVRRS
jgi:hypothetical protein